MIPSLAPHTVEALQEIIEDLRKELDTYRTPEIDRRVADEIYHYSQLLSARECDEVLAII